MVFVFSLFTALFYKTLSKNPQTKEPIDVKKIKENNRKKSSNENDNEGGIHGGGVEEGMNDIDLDSDD
jgi:hypothetical protein